MFTCCEADFDYAELNWIFITLKQHNHGDIIYGSSAVTAYPPIFHGFEKNIHEKS